MRDQRGNEFVPAKGKLPDALDIFPAISWSSPSAKPTAAASPVCRQERGPAHRARPTCYIHPIFGDDQYRPAAPRVLHPAHCEGDPFNIRGRAGHSFRPYRSPSGAESGVEITSELSHAPASWRCGGQTTEHRGDRCRCVMTRPSRVRLPDSARAFGVPLARTILHGGADRAMIQLDDFAVFTKSSGARTQDTVEA
jgi:hypothetical protein